jgi:hypothetical protein
MAAFRDLATSDEEIRRAWFSRSRTGKYPPGDTRGWKLPIARRRMAADDAWRERMRTCLYRPYDRRQIYWSPAMIDWPRLEVMRHMEAGGNLALVCRRQMVRGAACNFFWIADDLVIDGYIRSDNRGSEAIFPLWLIDPREPLARMPNFTAEFRAAVERALGEVSPLELFQYIYAIFHAPAYRQRYSEPLSSHFPRVPLAKTRTLFDELAELGKELVQLHLLRGASAGESNAVLRGAGSNLVAPGFPQFADGAVAINPQQQFAPVAPRAWQFQVGAHQVLRKWLKDRRGRRLSSEEIAHYACIARSIGQSLECSSKIDELIVAHGGWPAAFIARHGPWFARRVSPFACRKFPPGKPGLRPPRSVQNGRFRALSRARGSRCCTTT